MNETPETRTETQLPKFKFFENKKCPQYINSRIQRMSRDNNPNTYALYCEWVVI